MCSDTRSAATFCCGYSIVGTLFMLMVVLMLTYQPLIMGGIDNIGTAKTNAWGAMFAFIVVFLLSVGFLVQDNITGGRGSERPIDNPFDYDGIRQPAILQDYASSLDLPDSVQEGVFS